MPLQKNEFMYAIPGGYRFVKYGVPQKNEYYLVNGKLIKCGGYTTGDYPIVEKILEQSKPQPELKLQYKTQHGDWRDVDDGLEYRIKPKTRIVVFRNWIASDGSVHVAINKHQIGQSCKWLGDWQEAEIEEND